MKTFEPPEMEILCFEIEDIITTSLDTDGPIAGDNGGIFLG